MILMVSVQDLYEAKQALKGGADIVDVKNLQEALVGSAHPNVVKQIRTEVLGILIYSTPIRTVYCDCLPGTLGWRNHRGPMDRLLGVPSFLL